MDTSSPGEVTNASAFDALRAEGTSFNSCALPSSFSSFCSCVSQQRLAPPPYVLTRRCVFFPKILKSVGLCQAQRYFLGGGAEARRRTLCTPRPSCPFPPYFVLHAALFLRHCPFIFQWRGTKLQPTPNLNASSPALWILAPNSTWRVPSG